MRTTLCIKDELLEHAKKHAAERHCTLTAVVEDALRLALLPRHRGAARQTTRLVTFRGQGLQPGVNLDSSADLLDLMDGRR